MEELDIKIKVGNRINELRKQKKLSILDLGYDADVSPDYVNDVILGRRNVSITIIDKIATALEISVKEFFDF
jgi:transcriptional regulator with XRE-family HTH domain